VVHPSRPTGPRGASRDLVLLEMTDEELGGCLANMLRSAVERAACDAVGIDAIYAQEGRNALAEPFESCLARRLAALVTESLYTHYLDVALRFDANAPGALAHCLAIRGDFKRAGRAMRRELTPAYIRQLKSKMRRHAMRATKLDNKVARIQRWHAAGKAIREKEHYPRMSNEKLAGKIATLTDDPKNSIRLELPKIGLDRDDWPKPVKPRSRIPSGKKLRSFGSLRR